MRGSAARLAAGPAAASATLRGLRAAAPPTVDLEQLALVQRSHGSFLSLRGTDALRDLTGSSTQLLGPSAQRLGGIATSTLRSVAFLRAREGAALRGRNKSLPAAAANHAQGAGFSARESAYRDEVRGPARRPRSSGSRPGSAACARSGRASSGRAARAASRPHPLFGGAGAGDDSQAAHETEEVVTTDPGSEDDCRARRAPIPGVAIIPAVRGRSSAR